VISIVPAQRPEELGQVRVDVVREKGSFCTTSSWDLIWRYKDRLIGTFALFVLDRGCLRLPNFPRSGRANGKLGCTWIGAARPKKYSAHRG
jgi:hypothetical protein